MFDVPQTQPPGWYYAQGDPPGTQRYWDGTSWQGGPQPVPGSNMPASASGSGALTQPLERIGGRVIDGIVWTALFLFANIVSGEGLSLRIGDDAPLLPSFLGYLFVTVYEVVTVGALGATAGKMALNSKVVNGDGSPATWITAGRRSALLALWIVLGMTGGIGGLLFLILAIAGLLMLFVDAKHQTPWDKLGNSLVVKR